MSKQALHHTTTFDRDGITWHVTFDYKGGEVDIEEVFPSDIFVEEDAPDFRYDMAAMRDLKALADVLWEQYCNEEEEESEDPHLSRGVKPSDFF